jgi:hypothetical protein
MLSPLAEFDETWCTALIQVSVALIHFNMHIITIYQQIGLFT